MDILGERKLTRMRWTRPASGPTKRLRWGVLGALAVCAGHARAGSWWLPPVYSEHGRDMDLLFIVVFWLTMAVMIGVFAVMAYFLVKYRFNPNRKKAHFSHGNTRLEMVWTIIPAIILAFISLYSKGVWDRYRHGDENDKRERATILVVGQQFQWNVVYAGPDKKLGRYLVYPKPSDKQWPHNADGTPFLFTFGDYTDTKGPADMPYEDAVAAINAYIDQENPLGKVFDDPAGKDDNWEKSPGRPIIVPKGRPIEVQLSSKDVLHSFYMPNMRLKLDAVPGLRGVLNFTPTKTSKEIENDPANRVTFKSLEEVERAIATPEGQVLQIAVDEKSGPKAADAKTPGAFLDRKAGEWKYNDKEGKTIVRAGQPLTPERVAALKAIGVKEVTMHRPGYFDLVCAELCGQGHYKMQGQVIVVTNEEFVEQFETKAEEANAGHGDEKTAVSKR